MIVKSEYDIRLTVSREMERADLRFTPEEEGRRLCLGIQEDIRQRTGCQVSGRVLRARELSTEEAREVARTMGRPPKVLRRVDREPGYSGKKRWMVSHELLGVVMVCARDELNAKTTAAAAWGVKPEAEVPRMYVRAWKEGETA